MKFRFPIVIIDEDYRSENTSGLSIRALAEAIEKEGFEVLGVTSYGDLSQFAQQQSRASAFILSIDDEEFTPGPELDPAVLSLREFIGEVRRKNTDVPIYIYGETKTSRHLPNDILRELHGFIHMFEDTPEFVSRHIIREAKSYLEGIQPPFFKALLDYAEDGSYSWHCPGHSGGVAFLKSPIGQMYHQFYGENMLRADVCNAVEELGQLLDHNGAIGESERNAARIFNADHCFFVTNGTSTSNKMVWHHTVAPGDVVVVDRNCHKSNLHAIIMTGAIPVFLKPTRNHYGIIGPIPQSEFEPAAIKAKIRANPLLKGVDPESVRPRILTLTQSTYDGVLYNTETIKGMVDGYVDNLHFDEAWLPHAAFHPFYGPYHAMGKKRARPKDTMVYSTQSIHKLLAGISQASHVLVQDSQSTKLDRHLFNEAYLMHTSTSGGQRKVQRQPFALAVVRAAGIGPDIRQLGLADAEVLRPQQGVGLAIAAAGHLAHHMADQPAKAQVHLARRVHHRRVHHRQRLGQLGLALHGQHTVGGEPQGAQKEVEVRLEFGRGFRRQGWQSGHALSGVGKMALYKGSAVVADPARMPP